MTEDKRLKNLKPLDSKRAVVVGRKGGLAKKGSKHINTWVQELLHDEDFKATYIEGFNVKEYKGAPIKAIIKAQIIKALTGDTKAYDSLVKSGWVAKMEADFTSNGETVVQPVDMNMLTQFLMNVNENTKR